MAVTYAPWGSLTRMRNRYHSSYGSLVRNPEILYVPVELVVVVALVTRS